MVSVIHSINAAFGVSTAFVPYRPNYDLVAQYASVPRTKLVYCDTHAASYTHRYMIRFSDFIYSQFISTETCGTYLISVVTWAATPKHGLWIASFSGGVRRYVTLSNIVGGDAATVSVVTDVDNPYIEVVASGKVAISTLN